MIAMRGPKTSTLADSVLSTGAQEVEREILSEERFLRRIAVERKRTERSREPFLLILLEYSGSGKVEVNAAVLETMMSTLAPATRETDAIGWYRRRTTIGILFPGIAKDAKQVSGTTVLNRVTAILSDELTVEQFSQVTISFHFFPDEWNSGDANFRGNPAVYPDLVKPKVRKRILLGIKRAMDIAVASLLLLIFLPACLLIAFAIKITSKGPVLFRQERVGQYGRRFRFLKFRSMYVNSDSRVHQEYVEKLIAGNVERVSASCNGQAVYKLANDKRITPLGRFLRQTSLDELPQFVNVICGEMSLVGPRPPLPYELAAYQTWHRGRLLQVKPGITGLWQVTGRSRVGFDEMVRLDLQYATSWTPWLDIKILFLTPGAVLKGAY